MYSVFQFFPLTSGSFARYWSPVSADMAPAAVADASFPFLSGVEAYNDVSAPPSPRAMHEWFLI
jgi:hypothetical protein